MCLLTQIYNYCLLSLSFKSEEEDLRRKKANVHTVFFSTNDTDIH